MTSPQDHASFILARGMPAAVQPASCTSPMTLRAPILPGHGRYDDVPISRRPL
jgi:hypothetical protein